MQNTDSENSSSDSPPPKRPVGKPRTAMWRYEREDGKYNKNPLSSEYYNDYYVEHLKNIYIECPHCKTMIGKKNYARHINHGKKCLKIRSLENI
jgi:hypothetical protein